MSLLNVWVKPQKAMVVVDTEAAGVDAATGALRPGHFFEGSKMFALPHANVIVAGRGSIPFLGTLSLMLMSAIGCSSFDDCCEIMPMALSHMSKTTVAQQLSLSAQEIVLVGYSGLLREVFCMSYVSKDGGAFVSSEIDKAYFSPWTSEWGSPMRDASTPEHARIFATEQVANALALDPDKPCGGRLLLAEVTRDDLRISTLGPRLTDRSAAKQ